MGHALASQAIERAMQFDRVGRGERAVLLAARRDHADGADARSLSPERRPDLPGESGDRGLTAGAGDGGDHARLTREEGGGAERQRPARIVDRDESNIVGQAFRALFGDDRDRAGRRRRAGEIGAVGLGARPSRRTDRPLSPCGCRRQYRRRRARRSAGRSGHCAAAVRQVSWAYDQFSSARPHASGDPVQNLRTLWRWHWFPACAGLNGTWGSPRCEHRAIP